MVLLDYDAKVLEKLSEGKKNIYQLHKEIKKDVKKVPYSTIQRATVRLEEKGLIELIGRKKRKGPLPAKDYKIFLKGMAELYFAKRKKSDNGHLEFHRSEEAQKIIDKIIRIFFKEGEDRDKEKENLFLRTLRISPTLIEVLLTLDNIIEPLIIRDSILFEEMFEHSLDLSPLDIFLKIEDENKVHISYLKNEFPIKILAEDFDRYPNDDEIKILFSKALMERYRSIGKESMRKKKELFTTVLKAVSKKMIDPKGSIDDEWSKFEQFVISEKGKLKKAKDCCKHLFLYIPPGSDPRLLCDGMCTVPYY